MKEIGDRLVCSSTSNDGNGDEMVIICFNEQIKSADIHVTSDLTNFHLMCIDYPERNEVSSMKMISSRAQ